MKIAYRRMSGAVGFGFNEKGARGLWLDKRIWLLNTLRSRGHHVDVTNRLTKESDMGWPVPELTNEHEVMFIEFGSSNQQFYGEDLTKTFEMIAAFQGRKIIFICDDPDLPFTWKSVPANRIDLFSAWMNCNNPAPLGGMPIMVPLYDFPISGCCPESAWTKPATEHSGSLAYIGRGSGGRKEVVEALLSFGIPLRIYAKAGEWPEKHIYPAPSQSDRTWFYNQQAGCLALADTKHKKLGWRTGRAYHAIRAGCPVLAEKDHPVLSWAPSFTGAAEAASMFGQMLLQDARAQMVEAGREQMRTERKQVEAILAEHGL